MVPCGFASDFSSGMLEIGLARVVVETCGLCQQTLA